MHKPVEQRSGRRVHKCGPAASSLAGTVLQALLGPPIQRGCPPRFGRALPPRRRRGSPARPSSLAHSLPVPCRALDRPCIGGAAVPFSESVTVVTASGSNLAPRHPVASRRSFVAWRGYRSGLTIDQLDRQAELSRSPSPTPSRIRGSDVSRRGAIPPPALPRT